MSAFRAHQRKCGETDHTTPLTLSAAWAKLSREPMKTPPNLLVSLERPPVRVRLAQGYEDTTRAACQAAWPRFRLSLTLTDWRGLAAVELRAASGRVLDRSHRPGLPLPTFGDEVAWAIYRGRCWWTFRRRQGCEGCGGLRCVCHELAAAVAEQLELTSWLAARGYG